MTGGTLFKKSNFCPKIQFWQSPNIFTSFSHKIFWQFFSWNQSCQQLKCRKPRHFHEFFNQKKPRQFSQEIKVEYLDKKMKISNSVAGKRSWNLLGNKFDQLFADFFRNIGNTLNSKLLLSEDEKALLAFGSTGMQPCANPHRLSSQFFGQDSKIVNEMQTGFTLRLIHLSNSILANGHVHLTIRKDQF